MMVGRTPNHPEHAMITLMKRLGFRQGPVKKTGVRWHRRSLKRALLPAAIDYNLFYNNCVWGPFRCPDGKARPFEMDITFPDSKLDVEIDGFVYHSGYGQDRDRLRDESLKAAGWTVIRVTTDQVYRVFVPLLSEKPKRGRG